MNSFHKYLIFFIIGVILSILNFKKDLVEGLPPIICGLTQGSTGRPQECGVDNDVPITKIGNMLILNNTRCTKGASWVGRDDWDLTDWSKYEFPKSGTDSDRENFLDCRYRCNLDNTCAAVSYRFNDNNKYCKKWTTDNLEGIQKCSHKTQPGQIWHFAIKDDPNIPDDFNVKDYCPPGYKFNSHSNYCEQCPDGTKPDTTKTRCEGCGRGTAGLGGRCTTCPDGSQPNANRTSCLQVCPSNKINRYHRSGGSRDEFFSYDDDYFTTNRENTPLYPGDENCECPIGQVWADENGNKLDSQDQVTPRSMCIFDTCPENSTLNFNTMSYNDMSVGGTATTNASDDSRPDSNQENTIHWNNYNVRRPSNKENIGGTPACSCNIGYKLDSQVYENDTSGLGEPGTGIYTPRPLSRSISQQEMKIATDVTGYKYYDGRRGGPGSDVTSDTCQEILPELSQSNDSCPSIAPGSMYDNIYNRYNKITDSTVSIPCKCDSDHHNYTSDTYDVSYSINNRRNYASDGKIIVKNNCVNICGNDLRYNDDCRCDNENGYYVDFNSNQIGDRATANDDGTALGLRCIQRCPESRDRGQDDTNRQEYGKTDYGDAEGCSCPDGEFGQPKKNPNMDFPDQLPENSGVGSIPGCHKCNDGYQSLDNESCTPCPVGQYSSNGICTPCDYGTYNDSTSASSCTACPDNSHTSNQGSTSLDDCISCGVGEYVNASKSGCIFCPPGTYHSPGTSTCNICEIEGQIPTSEGTGCAFCPEGETPVLGDDFDWIHIYNLHKQSFNLDESNISPQQWWEDNKDRIKTQCVFNENCNIRSSDLRMYDIPESETNGDIIRDTSGNIMGIKRDKFDDVTKNLRCRTESGFIGRPTATKCSAYDGQQSFDGGFDGCYDESNINSKINEYTTCSSISDINMEQKCKKEGKNVLKNKKCDTAINCISTEYCCSDYPTLDTFGLHNEIYKSTPYTSSETITNLENILKEGNIPSNTQLNDITLKSGVIESFKTKFNSFDNFKINWIGSGSGQEEMVSDVWRRFINTINSYRIQSGDSILDANVDLSSIPDDKLENYIKLFVLSLDIPIKEEGKFKYPICSDDSVKSLINCRGNSTWYNIKNRKLAQMFPIFAGRISSETDMNYYSVFPHEPGTMPILWGERSRMTPSGQQEYDELQTCIEEARGPINEDNPETEVNYQKALKCMDTVRCSPDNAASRKEDCDSRYVDQAGNYITRKIVGLSPLDLFLYNDPEGISSSQLEALL